jgi:hypothetical protein
VCSTDAQDSAVTRQITGARMDVTVTLTNKSDVAFSIRHAVSIRIREPRVAAMQRRVAVGTQSTPLQISSDQALSALGVFSGDASLSGNPADVNLVLSPDKTFAAVEVCPAGSECLIMDWARQTGSYAATCQDCTGAINAADQAVLTCGCQNGEGQIVGTTSLPLPCGGTIDNLNGTLTCR